MIRRTMSAAFLNEVSNHPDVRPWLGGEGAVDWSAALSDPRNVALVSDGGGFVFTRLSDGLYEGHSQFLPDHRGAPVLADLMEALRYMFTRTDCVEIITRVPDDNAPARGLGRAGGFRENFHLGHDPRSGWAVSVQSMDLDRWRTKDDQVQAAGLEFHDMLKAAGAHDDHAEDEAHDRAVGACILTCKAGNPGKAVWAYNRWAVMAGYGPVTVANQSPLIIDIGTARIALLDNVLEVVQCLG